MYRNPADVRHIKRMERMLSILFWVLGLSICLNIGLWAMFVRSSLDNDAAEYLYRVHPLGDTTIEIHAFTHPVEEMDTVFLSESERDTLIVLEPVLPLLSK